MLGAGRSGQQGAQRYSFSYKRWINLIYLLYNIKPTVNICQEGRSYIKCSNHEKKTERGQEESSGDDRYVCDIYCGDDFTDRYLSPNSSRWIYYVYFLYVSHLSIKY